MKRICVQVFRIFGFGVELGRRCSGVARFPSVGLRAGCGIRMDAISALNFRGAASTLAEGVGVWEWFDISVFWRCE